MRFPLSTMFLAMMCAACTPAPSVRTTAPVLSLIPLPANVAKSPGHFLLRETTPLLVRADNSRARRVAQYFTAALHRSTGLDLDLRPRGQGRKNDAIIFELDPGLVISGDTLGEGYELSVAPHRIVLRAPTPHGLFDGAATLWQLVTAAGRHLPVRVPDVVIIDYPRFAWRGLMLDSVRHFQSPRSIKRLLDQMALHKLNVLHWHLTDDQGWRIPIPQYPKLTTIGAWRVPPSLRGTPPRYGGFYTREQIRDIVRYAAARFITIVPEIEMPGHAQAAIAAYPQFGVTGKRPPVSHDWGVHTWLFNVDDPTFRFLDTVLGDVIGLFPGPYVHVGGDEAAKDQWRASGDVQRRMRRIGIADEAAFQGWFTARIGRYLAAHGRRMVGWDDILQGGALPHGAIVMSWRGADGAVAAAQHGHDVIMATSPTLYFDHVQSKRHDEPPGRSGVESLAAVYAFNPIPKSLTKAQAAHVLGAQGNLWTEYMSSTAQLEHAAFPRLDALSEVLWTPAKRKQWRNFLSRLPAQLARYRAAGIAFADSAFAVDIDVTRVWASRDIVVKLSNQAHYGTIFYTLDDSTPTPSSSRYSAPLHVSMPATIRAATFARDGVLVGTPRTRRIDEMSLLRRNSDELGSCKPPGQGLWLRLPGPAAAGGEIAYRVDIFDPCWIFPQVDLNRIHNVDVSVARVPYYFQLWKDATKVVLRKPAHPGGELQVHRDTCAGELLASVPLDAPTPDSDAFRLSATLRAAQGTHDLCFTFTRARISPLWLVDSIQLLPGAPLPH